MFHARERMNDYRQIAAQRNPWKRFLPQTAYRMHRDSRHFIEAAVKSNLGPTVAVTHHLPHPRSIPQRFKGDLLNAAYASDLSELIEQQQPALWVHGHTHDSSDYWIEHTRIVCNPRGYDDENRSFNPALILQV
jgi:Icc-related predicted phosphoesterase